MKDETLDILEESLGDIFDTVDTFKFDEKDFIKRFITSKDFNYMSKDCGHRYWTFGEGYVVTDFANKMKVKSKSNNEKLSSLELKWLGSIIVDLVLRRKINPNQIASKLDKVLKYTEFIDYHSPEEIIEKCQLV